MAKTIDIIGRHDSDLGNKLGSNIPEQEKEGNLFGDKGRSTENVIFVVLIFSSGAFFQIKLIFTSRLRCEPKVSPKRLNGVTFEYFRELQFNIENDT